MESVGCNPWATGGAMYQHGYNFQLLDSACKPGARGLLSVGWSATYIYRMGVNQICAATQLVWVNTPSVLHEACRQLEEGYR